MNQVDDSETKSGLHSVPNKTDTEKRNNISHSQVNVLYLAEYAWPSLATVRIPKYVCCQGVAIGNYLTPEEYFVKEKVVYSSKCCQYVIALNDIADQRPAVQKKLQ